ncbi:recombinase family protein [Aerococcaceae bacterium NML191219]|nr:recombinase family protein [Aerococcaceae bacterium NML191219]
MTKTVKRIQSVSMMATPKLRVAAYARVSHTYLLKSLSHQISHYSDLIQKNPAWVYEGVYIDEAISGRNGTQRKEYQRLIQDCKNGKIDMILTKSISRFGRNTVELLKTIRELKRVNVSVRFEKENIDTLSTEGELLLTLLASLAEEESESVSQNIRWKIQKTFEQGIPYIKQDMFGYRFKETQYIIEEKEAAIVKEIFSWYMEGASPNEIVKQLNEKGCRTRKGNLFTKKIIHNILSQETYTGKLILQKTYRSSYKGRSVENKGERPKYIVDNAHEPIITQETFDLVQQLKKTRRKRKGEANG